MKRIALILLLIVTALYCWSRAVLDIYPWAHWLKAFSEAAMIGALADWFAVVALFRHPMSLPIPHTAIIPRNKDRISETLGNFIQQNFLSARLVSTKLEDVDLTAKILTWLEVNNRLSIVSHQALQIVIKSLRGISDEKVLGAARAWVQDLNTDPATLAKALNLFGKSALQAEEFNRLLDRLLEHAGLLLSQHSDFLRLQIHRDMPWYIPRFVQDKLYKTVVVRVETFLQAVAKDPQHPARDELKAYLTRVCDELLINEDVQKKLSLLVNGMLNDPTLQGFFKSLWSEILKHLEYQVDIPNSNLNRGAFLLLEHLHKVFSTDAALRTKANGTLLNLLCHLAENHGEFAAHFISSTMKTWDASTLSSKIEEQIGQDLQFVRVNGTLVGGSVGLVLEAFNLWMK